MQGRGDTTQRAHRLHSCVLRVDVWFWIILCCREMSCVLQDVYKKPWLYALDASIPQTFPVVITKNVSRHCQTSRGGWWGKAVGVGGGAKLPVVENQCSLTKLSMFPGESLNNQNGFPLLPRQSFQGQKAHPGLCQQPAQQFTSKMCKQDSLFSLPGAFSLFSHINPVFAFVPHLVYQLTPSHVRKQYKITNSCPK